jgi:hypothetical protein
MERMTNMADDLSRLWGNFSLGDDKIKGVKIQENVVENVASHGQLCLVGRLMSNRTISKETVQSKLIQWWRPTSFLSFKVVGCNLFLIEFEKS